MPDMLPPQSKEAELIVLAAAFRLPEAREEILIDIPQADLYFDVYQKLMDAIRTLHGKGQPCDLPAVFQLIIERGQKEDVGAQYMGQMWEDWAGHSESIGNWRHYAEIVREKAKARRVIHICTETLRDAYSPVGTMEELIGTVDQKLFGLAAGSRADEPATLSQSFREALHEIDERQAGRGDLPLPTGFAGLDGVLGGFRKGHLVVLAARPSVGKTSLGLGFALHAIQTVPAMIFSMEMSRQEIAFRALAVRSSVALHAITGSRAFKPGEYEAVVGAVRDTPHELQIQDRSNLSAGEVARMTRRAIRKHGVKLVVVAAITKLVKSVKQSRHSKRWHGIATSPWSAWHN